MVFTDYVYKYDVTLAKTRVIVLVTEQALFILQPSNYQVTNFVKLDQLFKMLTIQTNSSILALNFKGSNADLLLETIRRTEFIIFLLQSAD